MKKLSHKKIAGIVGAIALAALLITGTFAWSAQLNQINEFVGTAADKDLALHDNYDPETGDKAVFLENTGGGVMFVRVRLDEFMDLTRNAPPADIDWTRHIPDASVTDCGLSNNALDLFHDYFTWHFGGQTYFLSATEGGIRQDIRDFTRGGEVYNSLTQAERDRVRETAEFSAPHDMVIPMAQWINAPDDSHRRNFVGWVYDTDGWAYWSQPLFAGQVTGLLLNRVDTCETLADTDFYYAINVIAEAVDHTDLPMWLTGAAASTNSDLFFEQATPNAQELLALLAQIEDGRLTANPVASLAILTPPARTTYNVGELFERGGMVIRVTFEDGTTEDITRGFSHSPANPLRADHTEVVFTFGGQEVRLPITVTAP